MNICAATLNDVRDIPVCCAICFFSHYHPFPTKVFAVSLVSHFDAECDWEMSRMYICANHLECPDPNCASIRVVPKYTSHHISIVRMIPRDGITRSVSYCGILMHLCSTG